MRQRGKEGETERQRQSQKDEDPLKITWYTSVSSIPRVGIERDRKRNRERYRDRVRKMKLL